MVLIAFFSAKKHSEKVIFQKMFFIFGVRLKDLIKTLKNMQKLRTFLDSENL